MNKPAFHWKSGKWAGRLGRIFLYILLIDLVLVFLYPFLFMLITSFKSYEDLIDSSVTWIINSFHVQNYTLAYELMEYPVKLLNTVLVAGLSTFGHIFSCSLAGYAFARYRYKYTSVLMVLVILSMIVPIQTLIVPSYLTFSNLGWLNTYLPLIVPTFFGFGLKGAMFIFLYRQFYLSLPRSLEEAAYIDGCGPVRTYLRIAFPSATASTMGCAVLSVVWHWNDYFEPGMYLSNAKRFLLPQVLPNLYNLLSSLTAIPGESGAAGMVTNATDAKMLYNAALIMAATVLCLVPLLIGYFVIQRWFMESVEHSGITGE